MKKPKAPRLVTVTIFTTITIVFWVFFTLYNILTGDPTLEIDQALLEPINPTLDTKTLGQIENRTFFEESEVTTPLVVSSKTSPTTTEAPVEEEVITPIETPGVATDEAALEQ